MTKANNIRSGKVRNLFRRLRGRPDRHTRTRDEASPFHPHTVLRDWGNGDAFRISDSVCGCCIFGATGSGKSSAVAKHLAYSYLGAGFGGVVLVAKPDERQTWERWAAETGRSEDLVIVDVRGKWRFNPLAWEVERKGEGGGFTIEAVSLLDEIASLIANNGAKSEAGGSDRFWSDALSHMNHNLVDLPLLAGMDVSLPLLRDIVNTAPLSPEQVEDPQWHETSTCAAILREAAEATANADAGTIADFQECRTYWLREFPNLSEKTRSIIVLTFSMMVRPLISRPLRKLFSSDTNITPEDTFNGKILVIDIPVQEHRLAGRIANLIFKYCFQIAVMRRVPPRGGKFLRPVFLFADECQFFATATDAKYQAVARSAHGATVYLTQNRASLRTALGNNDAVDSLLGNLQTLFFCANTGDTNDWAANLLGQHWVNVSSANVGISRKDDNFNSAFGSHSSGISRNEQRRYFVESSAFTTLKRGGAQHGNQVEAIVYNGGHLFKTDTGAVLPYRLLTFNQS